MFSYLIMEPCTAVKSFYLENVNTQPLQMRETFCQIPFSSFLLTVCLDNSVFSIASVCKSHGGTPHSLCYFLKITVYEPKNKELLLTAQ